MSDRSTRPAVGAPAGAVGALVRLTLADLLRTQRAALVAVVLALPVAFAVVWSLTEWITGDALVTWGKIFILGYLNMAVPFTALIVGASLIGAEHESQTLVYLLTRPVARWKTALVKFATAAVLCVAGVVASMALAFAALFLHFGLGGLPGRGPMMVEAFPFWLHLAGVGAAATVVYLAVFFLAGMTLRRPVTAGVLFIVVWEGLVGFVRGVIRFATVVHYLRSLAIAGATKHEVLLDSIITVEAIPAWAASVVLAALTGILLSAALGYFSRAEYPTSPDR